MRYSFVGTIGMCVGGLAVALPASADLTESPVITFNCNGIAAFDDGGRPGFAPGEWFFEGDHFGDGWNYSYEIMAIVDPVLAYSFSWTNSSSQTQSYLFSFSLTGIDQWDGDIDFSGLLNATVQDNNGNGATFATANGLPLFTGAVDGVNLLTLGNNPFSLQASAGGSASTGNLSGSGSSGIGYESSLTVQLSFSLSAGDSVNFGGNWTVNPVPAPGAIALLLACGPLVARGRRRD